MNFSDKVGLITGASGGIGRATAARFIHEGMKVVALVDLSDGVFEIAETMNDESGREVAVPFRGDVTDRAFRRAVYAELNERFGCVNACVPAAGIVRDALAVRVDRKTGELNTFDQDAFEEVVRINLTASVFWAIDTVASVAADRHKRGLGLWTPEEELEGAVVFIGSISSAGNRGQIAYASAKAALDGAQATLAKESIGYGVRTAIIHPGFTDTPMLRALGERFLREKVLPNTQLKRLLAPEEIADAIAFMIRNTAVSGALWADAGWHPAA